MFAQFQQYKAMCGSRVGKLHLAEADVEKSLVQKVDPVYPPEAKAAGTQGKVILCATIEEEGDVQNLRIGKSDSPLLDQAALDSVSKWQYRPIVAGRDPVEVDTTITVDFNLSKP